MVWFYAFVMVSQRSRNLAEEAQKGTLEQILYGPSSTSDGTQNLLGALSVSMGMVGAFNIREFQQKSDVRFAPAVKTEGKYYQLGME